MNNYFRYTPTDEEIRSYYGEILHRFKSENIIDTEYHEDIALLMAHVNKLLTTDVDGIEPLNLEKWKITLDTIKLKAGLIKEQRLERERLEKAEERKAKMSAIPIEDFKNAITSIITIVIKFVPQSQITNVISELNEVVSTCKPSS